MISHIWFYSLLPAFVALCCTLLFIKAYFSGAGSAYIKLFANLIILNTFQAVAYILFAISPSVAEYAADAYLMSVYFLFSHLLLLALSLREQGEPKWGHFLYVFPVTLVAMHLSGLMIESYRVEKNSLMHNDGVLAWMFDLFIIVSSLMTAIIFFTNTKARDNHKLASRNIIALVSFIPLICTFSLLIIVSRTEYAVPVVIVVPIISLYIASVFYYISKSRIIDLTIGPAAFFKRVRLAFLLLESLKTKGELDDFNNQLRQQRYREAMEKHNNDFNAAAAELKVHHTTLRNSLKETSD